MIGNAVGTLVGILVGSYVTYLASRHYYEKASEELRREAERLRSHTNLIIRAMHNAGLAEVRWNEHGEPVGLVINLSGVAGGRSSASAEPTVGGESSDEPH